MTAQEALGEPRHHIAHRRVHLVDTAICMYEDLALDALDVVDGVNWHDMYLMCELNYELGGYRRFIGITRMLSARRGACIES